MDLFLAGAIGVALDFVFGDPARMPHMVRAVGSATPRLEGWLVARLGRSVFSGALLWLVIVGASVALYLFLASAFYRVSPWLKLALDAVIVFQAIAYRDLVKHIRAVQDAFRSGLSAARRAVSMIVGRDVDRMEKPDICRAAIESGSENLNDAVVAPLFWFALLGPVGALIYRISNTLDAIVGHRTERYELFGKVSARVDDVLNFLPARLCCLLILPFGEWGRVADLGPDARKHPSLNSGWPEAAMAKRLGVVIGGRMYAKGKLVQTAEMNAGARQPTPDDIDRSIQIMFEAYLKLLLLLGIVLWLRSVVG